MISLGIVVVLVIGLGIWFHILDTNPTVAVPAPAMPVNNAYTYYKSAAESVVDSGKIEWAIQNRPTKTPQPKRGGLYPGSSSPGSVTDDRPYSLSEKEAIVAENSTALQLLHTGFRYPCQEPSVRSFNANYPEYQKQRGVARLLALQAQADAQTGDWNGALKADLDAVQLGETMPRGGGLIAMLVGEACQSIGRRRAWEAAGHLNAAQAGAAAKRLAQIQTHHVPTADVLEVEKWGMQASLMELMHRKDWPGAFLGIMGNDAGNNNADDGFLTTANFDRWKFATLIRLTGKRTIMANYTHYMDQSIADARQPYAIQTIAPPVPSDAVNQVLLPVFAGVRFGEVGSQTQNALLLMTLALQAYQIDHHAYPRSLSQLAPQYLQAVPADPFAPAKPLAYKRFGAKYILYSVGPDGKDDGGKAIFNSTKPGPTTPSDTDKRRLIEEESLGDIVAGVNIL